MIDSRMIDTQLQKRNEGLYEECKNLISEKNKLVLENKTAKIVALIEGRGNVELINSEVNDKWSSFLFGKICVEYVFQQDNFNYYDFLKWFMLVAGQEASIGFVTTIKNLISEKTHLDNYLKIVSEIPKAINNNMQAPEYLWDRFKTSFKQILNKWDKNTAALNIMEKREYAEDDCWHSGIIYFAFYPLRNYKELGQILENFQYIHPIQYLFTYPAIKADTDILISVLNSAPTTQDKSGSWNKNKVALLALRQITYYLECISQVLDFDANLFKADVSDFINKIIETIENRSDSTFLLKNWILYLTNDLCSHNANQQKTSNIIMWEIAQRIENRVDLENTILENSERIDSKRVLLSLVILAPDCEFPNSYIALLSDYLCNETNRIFTGGYAGDPVQIEHGVIGQLFYLAENPVEKWKELWNKLYTERRKSYFSHFNDRNYFIDHSIYSILVGLSACEYFFTENTKIANEFLDTIWEALFEIYLDSPIESPKDIIMTSMSRILVLKARLGYEISEKLQLIENNAELIIDVINILITNKTDIQFIKNNDNIVSKLNYALELKRTNKYFDNYYKEIEFFLNK